MITKTKTFKTFIFSFIVIVITLGISTLKNYLSVDFNSIYFAVAITIAFGTSVTGLIFGFQS